MTTIPDQTSNLAVMSRLFTQRTRTGKLPLFVINGAPEGWQTNVKNSPETRPSH